jgi:hypothetical protein
MTELNGNEYLVVYIDANTFSLKTLAGAAVATTSYSAYVSGGKIAIVRDVGLTLTGLPKPIQGYSQSSGMGSRRLTRCMFQASVG